MVLFSIRGLHFKVGHCCDMSQNDTIGKIELIPFSVLSENKTNC